MSTSAAIPADLQTYARRATALDGAVGDSAVVLHAALQAFRDSHPDVGGAVPDLERRVTALAAEAGGVDSWVGRVGDSFAQADRGRGSGVVTVADGRLAAALAGQLPAFEAKQLAKRFAKAGTDRDRLEPLVRELDAHGGDPQFTAAFFNELGVDRTLALVDVLRRHMNGRRADEAVRPVSEALATATRSGRLRGGFVHGVATAAGPSYDGRDRWAALAQLLRAGVFSADFLLDVAHHRPDWQAQPKELLMALARNPAAAFRYATTGKNAQRLLSHHGNDAEDRVAADVLRIGLLDYPRAGTRDAARANGAVRRLVKAVDHGHGVSVAAAAVLDGVPGFALYRVKSFSVPRRPGYGKVRMALFIQSADAGLGPVQLRGDGRSFDAHAGPAASRAYAEVDFETGKGYLRVNPSFEPGGSSKKAWPIHADFGRFPQLRRTNAWGTKQRRDGTLVLRYQLLNSIDWFGPTIDGTIKVRPVPGSDRLHVDMARDSFPSLEVYQDVVEGDRLVTRTLTQQPECELGPLPGLTGVGTDVCDTFFDDDAPKTGKRQ